MALSDKVKIEILKEEESFQVWKFQITVLFKGQALMKIVNGVKKFERLVKDEEKA